jgi:hypothetical protein
MKRPLFLISTLMLLLSSQIASAQYSSVIKPEPYSLPSVVKGTVEALQAGKFSPPVGIPQTRHSGGRSPDAASAYTFSSATGTYTPITGGTVVDSLAVDDVSYPNQAIGFPFIFNGISYTTLGLNTNGFAWFGSTPAAASTYSPISGTTAYSGAVAPLGRDLQGQTANSDIRTLTQGTGPNRTFTVQWRNYRRYGGPSNENYNFQVRLTETTNKIDIIYGTFQDTVANSTCQIGLRGATNGDFNNRVVTTNNWTTSTAGTVNTALDSIGATSLPPSGLTYTFTPNTTVPASPAPATATSTFGATVQLNWTNVTGESGYEIYISTDSTNYSFLSLAAKDSTSLTVTGLTPLTRYYFQVYAYVEGGISAAATAAATTPAGLSGTKIIAASGGDYATFTAAATALNASGVGTGGLTFSVANGNYPERFTLGVIGGSSASNPVTFKAATGATVTLTGTGTSATSEGMVTLNGTSYITFDGINISDTSTTTGTQVEIGYYLQATPTAGNNGVTIKNATIVLGGNGVNIPTNAYGVLQNTGTPTAASGASSFNKYQNLTIRGVNRGIALFGSSNLGYYNQNNEISNNTIGSSSVRIGSAAATSTQGILASYELNAAIFNNTVKNVACTATSGSPTGIALQLVSGSAYNNKVDSVYTVSIASTGTVTGIQAGSTTLAPLTVYNNFVSRVFSGFTGTATATIRAVGINTTSYAIGSQRVYAYYNSANLVPVTGAAATYSSAAFNAAYAGQYTAVNNIFVNTIGGTASTVSAAFAIAKQSNTADTAFKANYNDLVSTGTQSFIGQWDGTTDTTLAQWKSVGVDSSSVSQPVTYTSTSDLHLSGTSNGDQQLGGIPIAGITTDIDGQNRNAIKPYKGADEASTPLSAALISSFSPANGPVGDAVVITGLGFDPTLANNTVKFGNTTATVLQATPTTLVALVPTGLTVGTGVAISVTASGLTGTSATNFTPTAAPAFQWSFATQTSGVTSAITSISAVSNTVAWAGGLGIYLKTTNGGTTWTNGVVTGASAISFYGVYGVDVNTAYLLGSNGTSGGDSRIYKTTNGGTNWSLQLSLTGNASIFLDGFAFWNATNGVAFGDPVNGSFYVFTTTNGGTNWVQTPSANIPAPLTGEAGDVPGTPIAVQGTTNVWFGTTAGRVYRSTNVGLNWTVANAPIDATYGVQGLVFKDANIGFATSGATTNNYARTFDGGQTWIAATGLSPAGGTTGISYIPTFPTTLVSAGVGAGYSVNDGGTWTSINTSSYNNVSFVSNMGWFVGNSGLITRATSTVGTPVESVSSKPKAFSLSQNYPNPFNPATTIQFALPTNARVTLKVYDVIGREVATLLNGDVREAGNHSVSFNASRFASGVYFYRLSAGSFVETKKMLLVK